jgi:hypothetical protein
MATGPAPREPSAPTQRTESAHSRSVNPISGRLTRCQGTSSASEGAYRRRKRALELQNAQSPS